MSPTRARTVVALGALAGALTTALVALRIGLLGGPLLGVPLLGGPLRGVGDNADGLRLFCTAGLRPDVPTGDAAWRGVVVTEFTTGAPPCSAPVSSAELVLHLAVTEGPRFSLVTLGWTYVVLTALAVALAAGALARVHPARALLVALPVLPLVAVNWWSRFAVSTYAEPAGLLGTVAVLLGMLVVVGSPPMARGPRAGALLLLAGGGLTAATAKPAFLVVGLGAIVVAAMVVLRARPGAPRWRRLLLRTTGPLTALLVLAAGAVPVGGALAAQDRSYAAINTHNLLFTALAPELGPGALLAVGLPPAAADHVGDSYYWDSARGIPGWDAAIGERPLAARAQARALLLEHPGTLATMVGRGLTATMRPDLDYLPAAPRGTAPESDVRRTIYPLAGPLTGLQLPALDAIALGWLPAVVAAAGLLAGAATLVPRRRRAPGRSVTVGLLRASALAAGLALGVVTLAVVGDGYYELTKHVWLASYLLVLVGLLLLAAAVAALRARRG